MKLLALVSLFLTFQLQAQPQSQPQVQSPTQVPAQPLASPAVEVPAQSPATPLVETLAPEVPGLDVHLQLEEGWTQKQPQRSKSVSVTEYIHQGVDLVGKSEIISHLILQKSPKISFETLSARSISRFEELKCQIQSSDEQTNEAYRAIYLLYDCPSIQLLGMNQFIDGGEKDTQLHTLTYEIKGVAPTEPLKERLQNLFMEKVEICKGPCLSRAPMPTSQNQVGSNDLTPKN